MEIFNRLDELEIKGSGFGGGGAGAGTSEDHADVSPNLIRNPGFEDWTTTNCDYWQSAAGNDWNTGSNYAKESSIIYSLPYSVKLGNGSNTLRGIAQASAFRVVPGESYYLSARLVGADAAVEYMIILKALESDGATEITTGTPLGSSWTYSASFGGWHITGVAGTDWVRVTAPIVLAPDDLAADVCYLRGSIQYYQEGSVKYLYADDFAVTRGSQLPAFSYYYLTEPSESDAHKLLSLTHTDTLVADVVAGDLLFGNATPKWARLVAGSAGYILTMYGGYPTWRPPSTLGMVAHPLLGSTWHTDVLNGSPVAGGLIYADSTPAWAQRSAGPAGYVLTMYGGYPTWRPPSGGGVSGSGTTNHFALWTDTTILGDAPLFIDTGISGNPVRAITYPWRFEVMPIRLFNASSLLPTAPSLYMTNLYRRQVYGDVARNGRLMQMTPDGEELTLVSHIPAGHDKCSAAFFREESDGNNPSSTLVANANLFEDPITGNVYYKGVELPH